MSVRVCHFSDWHGSFQQLPEADLYVCTGDMLWNHPIKDRDKGSYTYRRYTIDREHERLYQARDIEQILANGGMRRFLGSPDAPVVCVRGNHDFIDLAPLFADCNLACEFINNEVAEVCGLRIAGHRGVPWINDGRWCDETQRAELLERARCLPPDLDLVLTHYSACGILDKAGSHTGLEGFASVLGDRLRDGGVHCFGHIHECGGLVQELGELRFSNAACTFNVFEVQCGH